MKRDNRQLRGLSIGVRYLLTSVFLVLLTGVTPLLAQMSKKAPKLEIPNDYFYFGYMPRDAIVAHTYWMMNNGNDTLDIISLKPSCGCTAAPLKQDRIAPHDSASFTISFNSKLLTGKVVKEVDVFTNDPSAKSKSVRFFAVVNQQHPKVHVEPQTLRFAKFGSEDGRLIKQLTITNGFDDAISVSLPEFPDKYFTVDKRSVKIEGGQQATLTIEQVKVPTDKDDYLTSLTLQFEGPETERITVPIVSYFKEGE